MANFRLFIFRTNDKFMHDISHVDMRKACSVKLDSTLRFEGVSDLNLSYMSSASCVTSTKDHLQRSSRDGFTLIRIGFNRSSESSHPKSVGDVAWRSNSSDRNRARSALFSGNAKTFDQNFGRDRFVVKEHVKILKFHRFPTNDESKKKTWTALINKGRVGSVPSDGSRICSNHFSDGKPTARNPNPTLWLTVQDNRPNQSVVRRSSPRKRGFQTTIGGAASASSEEPENADKQESSIILPVPMKFEQLNREFDVRFCTGLEIVETFKAIFDYLHPRSRLMKYWEGPKRAFQKQKSDVYQQRVDQILSSSVYAEGDILPINRKGPERKLCLEQEYLLVLMRLRLGLFVKDLAFRFQTSTTRVSQIWITWIKLLSKELRNLIIWPSKGQIIATLPDAFKRLYPKVRTIIDCTEVFVENSSSLEVQAILWSDYKHHCTVKFLVAITPNGAISWVSPCFGGRTTDLYIVRYSGFLDLLEPYDTVIADRGFKIKSDLLMKRCFLAIPPSAARGTQMTQSERTTNRVANVWIFVEKAIARVKWFHILKREMSLLEMPLVDDIVVTCCALVNLLPPLVE
ncbi:uncharacterized protein LOC135694198 [Rhopilema esculentum]|uniref:uncharacterized protein LOC135694198 n=1 Tax=Rhopilema esculentum TaxID=499914 RepID=UPI0031D882A2